VLVVRAAMSFEGLWQAESTFLADFGGGRTGQATVSVPRSIPDLAKAVTRS
jgi:hypothetical protein